MHCSVIESKLPIVACCQCGPRIPVAILADASRASTLHLMQHRCRTALPPGPCCKSITHAAPALLAGWVLHVPVDRYRLRKWKQAPEPFYDCTVPGEAELPAGECLVERAVGAQQRDQGGLIGFERGVGVV